MASSFATGPSSKTIISPATKSSSAMCSIWARSTTLNPDASDFSLPEAILKFRQGVGRLIRTKSDTGIVVVLDNRMLTNRYGQAFLDALPKCPQEIV